jgi:hypothetical protein
LRKSIEPAKRGRGRFNQQNSASSEQEDGER